jgi:hypothetical protein
VSLNTSVQSFAERLWLNDLNHYLLYSPEEHPKQIDQYDLIEIRIKPRL